MQKGKILQKSILVAAAAVSLAAAPTIVKADGNDAPGGADTPAPTGTFSDAGLQSVSVDASNALLTITPKESPKEVLVGTGKVKIKKGETSGTITVSNWDVYEPRTDGTVKVDLSKLKNTVDNYLVLQSNTAGKNVAIVKIPVKAKYIKAKVRYEAGEAILQAGYGETSKEAALEDLKLTTATEAGKTGTQENGGASAGTTKNKAEELQYRTAYSSEWQDMVGDSAPDLELYQENGAQLYVRLKAGKVEGDTNPSNDGTLSEQNGKETLAYDKHPAVKVYQSSSLPGKEVKVTIAAKAKGPSISADFTKGTVKIPKKTEYRLVENNEFIPNPSPTPDASKGDGCKYYYRAATDGKAQSINDVFTAAPGTTATPQDNDPAVRREAVLEVRKAATDKKAASKWSRLEISTLEDMNKYVNLPAEQTLEKVTERKNTAKTKPTEAYTGAGIIQSQVFEVEGKPADKNIFTIEYAKSKSSLTQDDSVKITNKGVNDYEIYVDKTTTGTANPNTITDKLKTTKVPGRGTRTEKITTLKGLTDLSTVWIRKAGNKKNKDWATSWTPLGVVDYSIAATPAQTPSDPTKDPTNDPTKDPTKNP